MARCGEASRWRGEAWRGVVTRDEVWRGKAPAVTADQRAIIGRAGPVGGERVFLPSGIEGPLLLAGEAWTPPKSYPPSPNWCLLTRCCPTRALPLITSDPPPWDATAVDRNPP